MKQLELKRRLRSLGWWRLRQGARHEIWTNGGEEEPVPRHREISERLARKILETASRYPGEGANHEA